MPRRGEYTRDFPIPAPRSAEPEPARIGLREVIAFESNGDKVVFTLDPSDFTCSVLVGQLADEWGELAAAETWSASTVRSYRTAIESFCEHVDATVPRAGSASLGGAEPDLHFAVTEWIRLLPGDFLPGSRMPAWHAGRIRTLIARRIEHPDRSVAGHMPGWVGGALGLRRGQCVELDEFTRADKKALVQAAWADHLAIKARVERGWEFAQSGSNPAEGGWHELANLLWAIAHQEGACEEIIRQLPPWRDMPASLRDLLPEGVEPRSGKRMLVRFLVRQLYLHNLDLQSYRILLMAATGRSAEEVASLTEDTIEFGPRSVLIDFAKGRAHAQMRQAFSASGTASAASLHPGRPRLDAADLVRTLLELSRPLARRAGADPVPLFLKASLDIHSLRIAPFDGAQAGTSLVSWLQIHGVHVDGPADIRRLRKSGKVEKAIAFQGRVSDIADDHSEEVFRRHYAHGTTLRVISGNVITAAQSRWFAQAIDGPVVLTGDAEQTLEEPGSADALGLTREEIEDLRSGQLNMGVSSCKDPFSSPFGRPGQLCPVAPTRCLECRNAFVLPSNLPQLLLFADHLAQLQLRSSPQHFHALWGQSRINVNEAIRARTDAEIAEAHRQIAAEGLSLQLPLAAHVEFDA
ncbi:hypothetical protein AQJ46_48490 [Streptomyces canus]|uniref:Uncharacterized protein n=1 Tax=Streptomyces canus TaxID=58343 RepID=A0A101RKK4_9ACTN|nr:hypothetical protein [Streptomyces canus]KUN57218.1 hypothetical protein AQJ46_48490 [Streptomyces canus]